MTMNVNDDEEDDVVPLMEEPIVATVRMDEKLIVLPQQATASRSNSIDMTAPTSSSTPHMMILAEPPACSDMEDAIRRLTQFIIGAITSTTGSSNSSNNNNNNTAKQPSRIEDQQRQEEEEAEAEEDEAEIYNAAASSCLCSSLAEQLPEAFLPLYNAITMLQSHASLAHTEATLAVHEATTARRQAKLWKHRAAVLSAERNAMRDTNAQLHHFADTVAQERTLLKRAYKQLVHRQASHAQRQVETALLLHEDNLRSNTSSTEGTSATEDVSFDEEEEGEEECFKEVLNDETTSTLPESPISSKQQRQLTLPPSCCYQPLQLQVSSAGLQKQLLQKRPRAKIAAEELSSSASVPSSIVYQSSS